jgi:uncharacterized Zn-finger protein
VIPPPETIRITSRRVACDGSGTNPGDVPAALGHPRVWLEIDEKGYVDCGYCDRRFVLIGSGFDASGEIGAPGDIEQHGEDALGR